MRPNHPLKHHAIPIARPAWWGVFWSISALLVLMMAAVFIWPNNAALWLLIMVGGATAIVMSDKNGKSGHPLE